MADIVTPLVNSGSPDVSGYVDAITAGRVLGWAWIPRRPDVRLAIELRLGEHVIAGGLANQLRADLAGSGIGDGQHAFDIAIPNPYRDRAADLLVCVQTPDGESVTLGTAQAAESANEQIARLAHGIDMLVNSQRMMHRALQSAIAAADGTTFAKLAEAQMAMRDQFATLEHFVVRLDEQLLQLAPDANPKRHQIGKGTIVSLALAGLALIVGAAGLVRSLAG